MEDVNTIIDREQFLRHDTQFSLLHENTHMIDSSGYVENTKLVILLLDL